MQSPHLAMRSTGIRFMTLGSKVSMPRLKDKDFAVRLQSTRLQALLFGFQTKKEIADKERKKVMKAGCRHHHHHHHQCFIALDGTHYARSQGCRLAEEVPCPGPGGRTISATYLKRACTTVQYGRTWWLHHHFPAFLPLDRSRYLATPRSQRAVLAAA